MSSSSWRLLLMTATAAAMCLAVPRAVHAAPDSMVTPERPANSPGVHLFHMSWRGARDDRRAHIPGATHFDTNRIERPPLWRLVPDVDLERTMLELGVTRTTPVVLYGEPTMAATRVALTLLYAGVEDVRILDGGLAAWRASGRPVESGNNRPSPATTFGGPMPGRPGLIVHTREVRDLLGDPGSVVVSVRSLAEETGETGWYEWSRDPGNPVASGPLAEGR